MLNKSDRICLLCGRTAKNSVFTHRNKDYADYFQLHSKCIKDKIMEDGDPIDALRMLNVPYVVSIWDEVTLRSWVKPYDYISEYLKEMGRAYEDYPDFHASDYRRKALKEFEITDEMNERWGHGLDIKKYQDLESAYDRLIKLKKPENPIEENEYVLAAWFRSNLGDTLRDPDAKGSQVKNLQGAYEDAMKNIGLDTASLADSAGEKTLGERIAEIERTRPVAEVEPAFRDVDMLGDYITKYYTYPLLRNFDKADPRMLEELERIDYEMKALEGVSDED